MSKLVAKNVSLYVDDNTSTCRSISGFSNNLVLSNESADIGVTAFSDTAQQRLSNGLLEWQCITQMPRKEQQVMTISGQAES